VQSVALQMAGVAPIATSHLGALWRGKASTRAVVCS
jgi:hypothetical protein